MTALKTTTDGHVPVMLPEVLTALQPTRGGIYIDGTFGAGGYTRGLLEAGASQVIGIDRDPTAILAGQAMVAEFSGRLKLVQGTFSQLEDIVADLALGPVQGVVLDIGVSSMQLDQATRGFSFMREGPLDMRMSMSGPSAADYVNRLEADALANVIYIFGEEPRSRAIARAIVRARAEAPIMTTLDLVKAVEKATGPQRMKDRTHPATRTFQALRIFVNAELDELAQVLCAAEVVLGEGGRLAIVSFHSLEDRIVKKFFNLRCGRLATGSRFLPEVAREVSPGFLQTEKNSIAASEEESARNPRSRSAKLRFAIRSKFPAQRVDGSVLGLPKLEIGRV